MNSSGRVLYVQSELFLPGNPPRLHANEQGSQPSSMAWIDGVPLGFNPLELLELLKVTPQHSHLGHVTHPLSFPAVPPLPHPLCTSCYSSNMSHAVIFGHGASSAGVILSTVCLPDSSSSSSFAKALLDSPRHFPLPHP